MLRYVGQGYEIETGIDPAWLRAGDVAAIATAFAHAYRHRYGRAEQMPVELLSWRLAVSGPRSPLGSTLSAHSSAAAGGPRAAGRRPVWFEDGFVDTPVYRREALAGGHIIAGPAIVEEIESTLVLPPDFHLVVDPAANLVLTRRAP
jgi:N-methylhydantoinase A